MALSIDNSLPRYRAPNRGASKRPELSGILLSVFAYTSKPANPPWAYTAQRPVPNATSESSPASNSSRRHAACIIQLALLPLGDAPLVYHREIILQQAHFTGPPDHSGYGLSRMAGSGQQPRRTDLTAATARSHLSPFGSLGLYPHSVWPTTDHPCSKQVHKLEKRRGDLSGRTGRRR